MNNLQPLVWFDGGDTYGGDDLHADSPLHYYVVEKDTLDCFTVRYTPNDGAAKYATGFATIEDAKTWCWNHYNKKMQPYVKPSPTKVYELSFDYEDSYFTVFMTTDKQAALDFIESVKKHDEQFICDTSYDTYEYESINDDYNDNHPLKSYASKIFNSIYEDSFSEWASNYVGESFASQLSVIEHELFVKQGV